jgi:hypothetical protein
MAITARVRDRAEMLGAKADNEKQLSYCVEKAVQQAADYCNISGIEYFPSDAEIYLTEYVTAEYLLEKAEFSLKWEKMRKDAEIGLLRFRRLRW